MSRTLLPWSRTPLGFRFLDPALEARFRLERVEQSLFRTRVMALATCLAIGAMGWIDVMAARPTFSSLEYLRFSLWLRWFCVIPLYGALYFSTHLRGHENRCRWLMPSVTIIACWAFALSKWELTRRSSGGDFSAQTLLDTMMVLTISLLILPYLIRSAVFTAATTIFGIAIFYWQFLPAERAGGVLILAGGLSGSSFALLVFFGLRELAERRSFAQHEEVIALNAELARLNAEKNEFMAAAAHDLRAPLASVRGLAEQMRLGRFPTEERRERVFAAIDDLTGRMLGLLSDYLGAHAIESGTLPVRLTEVDLGPLVEAALPRHQLAAEAKQQQLLALPHPRVRVAADPALTGQVLDNFLTNAIKFSPAGATVRVQLAVSDGGERVRIEVIDEGPGIAPEEQGQLFRKFSRATSRPTAGESSHGLGLAIAKRVAEAMGGRVGCDSVPGEGATFWLKLPRA